MTFTHPLFLTFSHDHTAAALRSLLELVRRDHGTVTVMAVIPPAPTLQRLLTPRSTREQVGSVLHEELTAELEAWVRSAAGAAEGIRTWRPPRHRGRPRAPAARPTGRR